MISFQSAATRHDAKLNLSGRYDLLVAVDAVIFDWGGTLTPWHSIDHVELWRTVCAPHFPADHHDRAAAALEAEIEFWELSRTSQRSSTIFGVLERAGIEPTADLL